MRVSLGPALARRQNYKKRISVVVVVVVLVCGKATSRNRSSSFDGQGEERVAYCLDKERDRGPSVTKSAEGCGTYSEKRASGSEHYLAWICYSNASPAN